MPSHLKNSGADELRVAIIASDAAFVHLEAAWNAIARRSPTPSVFLSHEWFHAAWAWRRLDSTLQLHVVRKDEAIVGILPLIRNQRAQRGAHRLELLTVPDTQMSDLIVASDHLASITEAFAAALARQSSWDILDLKYLLPHGAAIQAFVPALLRNGLRLEVRDSGQNPFIALSGTWSDYYDTRSRKLKKNNNLAANRLKKAGAIRIDWLRSESCGESELERTVAILTDLSRRSWKRETGNSLDQPGPNAFVRSLSRAARDRGWLSVWLMYVAEQPLAMEYQLIDGGSVHALRSDFDANCEETSPGSYLFRQLLESSFGRGLQRYYMGPGDNAYKLRWTDQGEPLRRVIVYNRTLRGRLAWLRDAVAKPVLRAVRDRLKSSPVDASRDGSHSAVQPSRHPSNP